jgi:hypothetical protein
MRNIILSLAFFAMFLSAVVPARALDPTQPPGSNFDLSHWYLQLPTINGVLTGASGNVDTFSPEQLTAGATNAYFYTGPDGAMTFWAPDDGSTTSGSTHPRSELREQLIPDNNNTNWTLYGTHIMTATCVVSNVPSDTMKVCIGQIHEPNNKPDGSASANNEQMIMFDLSGSTKKIYANINLDGNQSSSFSVTLVSGSSVALGKPVNYTMSVVNGVLRIIINNVTNSWNLFSGTNFSGHVAQNWDAASGNTVYFKAGDYNQTGNACGCSTDGAKVAFYSLTRYHAPSITNQPASLAVGFGSNATFTVGASGNGSLSYQWLFNVTNSLAGATNASVTITNVAGANGGNYTVVVSDSTSSFSSVTSSIASLTVSGGGTGPSITKGPTNQTLASGNNATFTVAAGGTAPLNYQWWFNTNNILAGATNVSLTITNVFSTNAGSYSVVVTNPYGSTNVAATLTVIQATPVITVAPTASGISYGQTLASSTLSSGNATNLANDSAVAGVFTFTTPTTTPGAGTASQSVTFTPTDTTNYNNATTSVSVTVAPAGLTVSGIVANNKPYDGTTTATLNTGGATLVGNLDGGNVVLNTAGAAGTFIPDGNVGASKTVQISGLTISGPAANNYTLTQPATTANITALAATIGSYANGVMNINFYGIPGSNYVVLTTTNLGLPWWPLITNTAGSSSTWLFTDPNATNGQQFYRVTTP